MDKETACRRAIEEAGGPAELARALGITSQAISQWREVPVYRVLEIEGLLRGRITRYEMRPDVYGDRPR